MRSRRRARIAALALAASALALPAGARAASSCSYDVANATVQAQMLSPRVVIANAGDGRILVDGRACAAPGDGAVVATVATADQVVVSSAFPPATDVVVVDERHGRLADRRTGHRPKVFALTGTGGDTMEVIGSPGRDRYIAHDDLGHQHRPRGRRRPGLREHRRRARGHVRRPRRRLPVGRRRTTRPHEPSRRALRRSGPRRRARRALRGGSAPAMTYLVVGLDQSTFAPWHQNIRRGRRGVSARQIAFARAQARGIERWSRPSSGRA